MWTTKQNILERFFYTHEKSFLNLPRIRDSNLGRIVIWDHEMVYCNNAIFEKTFYAFGASIDGF